MGKKKSVLMFAAGFFVIFFLGMWRPLSSDSFSGRTDREKAKIEECEKEKKETFESGFQDPAEEGGTAFPKFKLRIPSISFGWGPGLRLCEDDLDAFRLGEQYYLQGLPDSSFTSDFDWGDDNWGCEDEVRLSHPLIKLPFASGTLKTSVGTGIGWSRYRTEGTYSAAQNTQNFWDETHLWDFNHIYLLKNTSFFLDARAALQTPFISGLLPGEPKIYGYFGFEQNFGKLVHDFEGKYDASFENGSSSYYNETETTNEAVKDSALGIRYGLGTQFKITDFLDLSFEFYGKHTKFDDWTGDSTYNLNWDDNGDQGNLEETIENGKLWFYRGLDNWGTYKKLEVQKGEPGGLYTDVRKAEIKLNRIGFRLTLTVRPSRLGIKF